MSLSEVLHKIVIEIQFGFIVGELQSQMTHPAFPAFFNSVRFLPRTRHPLRVNEDM
jgi:hypothetical protein